MVSTFGFSLIWDQWPLLDNMCILLKDVESLAFDVWVLPTYVKPLSSFLV